MLEAAQECIDFSKGVSRQAFDSDKKLIKALAMDIAIIGEAASRVTKETQVATSQIPWAAIIGMRNILIHAYFAIDHDQVWSTIQDDLPALIVHLQTFLQPPSQSPS